MVRPTVPCLVACLLASTAAAQTPPPAPVTSATGVPVTTDWPYPPPDPKTWWDDERPRLPEASDPLAGRRLRGSDRLAPIDNGFDPLLYRLWGLMPLQNQILFSGEMILEVAVRPSTSARQSLFRFTVRRTGDVFVQGRSGLGCCEAGIARRVGFDAKAPDGAGGRLLALRDDPLWSAPREVRVDDGSGAADAVCVDGTSYDFTLLVPGQARSVRRACDNAEVGQAAAVLETAFALALGHEPRIDVLYPTGADFSGARRAYEGLVADGGRLKPAPNARPQPPAFPPPTEDVAAPEPAS